MENCNELTMGSVGLWKLIIFVTSALQEKARSRASATAREAVFETARTTRVYLSSIFSFSELFKNAAVAVSLRL